MCVLFFQNNKKEKSIAVKKWLFVTIIVATITTLTTTTTITTIMEDPWAVAIIM
jgi:hypothetical protein